MGYIDYKTTIWNRMYFKEGTDMNFLIDKLKSGIHRDYITEVEYGFEKEKMLYDTKKTISPDENNGDDTVEVYTDDDKLIWTNTDD